MNRLFRRMQRFGKNPRSPENPTPEASNQSEEQFKDNTPQEVTSVRAKNEGHGKKTADKWNQ